MYPRRPRRSWFAPAALCTMAAAVLVHSAAVGSSTEIERAPTLIPRADVETAVMEARGRLDAVTVYRGQALVTRVIEVPGPAGLREVVVTDLPAHVMPDSIHAENGGGVTIRSVRYRERPVVEDVREEVREIDVKIRELEDAAVQSQRLAAVLQQRVAYLDRLEQFTAATTTSDLARGVLDPNAVRELTTLLFSQRSEIATEEIRLQRQLRDTREQIEVLQRTKAGLAGSSSRTAREAVVFAQVDAAGGGTIHLRYLVDRATWNPSYNMRTDAQRRNVVVEYNASVRQMSGEDWPDVRMTLSTASPALDAKAPTLDSLLIGLVPSGQRTLTVSEEEYHVIAKELAERQMTVQRERNISQNQMIAPSAPPPPGLRSTTGISGGGGMGGGGGSNYFNGGGQDIRLPWSRESSTDLFDDELNRIANELQVLELASITKVSRISSRNERRNEGISVTYALAGRTSLPSRADQQLIQIATSPLAGEFYRAAIPVLTNAIYEEARVTNTSGLVYLAGPVETYLDGQFVGRADLPTVTAGESFTIGFGSDPALRTYRELVQRDEITQGGNKIVTLRYAMTIDNFAEAPRGVRVFDRLPQAPDGQIRLTLVESSPAPLGTEAANAEREKKGILRWDLDIPANRIGAEAVRIEYVIRLEYDRQMTITQPDAATP